MSTPHIEAPAGAIADTVLLPGDPLRARHIAQTLLEEAEPINTVRNMLGYTGYFRGRRLSVMGTGMGIPSCAIYATELARFYGVKRMLRVGTCGGIGPEVELGDILLAQGASTDSRFNRLHFADQDFAATASFALLRGVVETGERLGMPLRVGGVFSTDCFYSDDPAFHQRLQAHGILGVEMESAGLYGLAAREGVQALSVLTVSDHLQRDQHLSAAERERGLGRMLRLVLESLVAG